MDAPQRFIRDDQDPGARIFVAPSSEAAFLCRRFGSLVAPAPGAETWRSRAVAMLVVAPFTQFTVFSFDLQAFLYEVFHQRLPAKIAHFLLMPAVNFFVLAALPPAWSAAYAALLAVWYSMMAVRARMVAWGLIMVAVVAGLWAAASAYEPFVNPWLGAFGCAALIALSHATERELPPRVTGFDRWLSLREFLSGPLPFGRRVRRLLLVAVQPVSGMLNEFVASPRLMPYGVLLRMLDLGYRPAVRAALREHVTRAEASGNPALDYVGIGGGTRLDAAVFSATPAAQAVR